jgi:hypothetical protein
MQTALEHVHDHVTRPCQQAAATPAADHRRALQAAWHADCRLLGARTTVAALSLSSCSWLRTSGVCVEAAASVWPAVSSITCRCRLHHAMYQSCCNRPVCMLVYPALSIPTTPYVVRLSVAAPSKLPAVEHGTCVLTQALTSNHQMRLCVVDLLNHCAPEHAVPQRCWNLRTQTSC